MEPIEHGRRFSSIAAAFIFVAALLFVSYSVTPPTQTRAQSVPARRSPETALTGIWRGNDGGTYFVRQVNQDLWWYGRDASGVAWTNVFHGRIQGQIINGNWADVPQGRTLSSGVLNLQISAPNRMIATYQTGGFGGSQWTR